ncbi:M phase phosphoprotein 10 isoform X2 [Malania oleifera]|uniref:M phase phosphoprotein 10 isoform X2 n=1 Tax=Malania oleifera TaxID=397392 RepID=UPI0025AE0808|nr:M phase phosphoprotein 10 isoform X2 [Malania oleifera]
MATPAEAEGFEALHFLKSVDPPLWLAPSQDLSHTARTASRHLFSRLRPFCPKSPFDNLLVEGFDAEQIWQQIDLQSQPLLSSLRKDLRWFEKNPGEISKLFSEMGGKLKGESENGKRETETFEEDEDVEEFDEEGFDDDNEDDDDDDEEEEEEEEEEDGEGEEGSGGTGGIEDKFLKMKDLEEYLEKDEAREYGLKKKKKKKSDGKVSKEEEEEEEEEEDGDEDEDEEEDDELGAFGDGDDESKLESARYEDFFGSKRKQDSKSKMKPDDGTDDLETDNEIADDKKKELSTHEKELAKLRSKIEEMEKANLEPRAWDMQGEVSAAKRPKNSALEVDLDFEHNVRPPPVITEEVTASLEDLIRKRILEGHFDDVQRAPSLPSKAPKELKELDENKSKKGLAEIYEEEYVREADPTSAPLSFSDEQKKEASMLFKKLCLKLDALSHFHFTPKPVIEEMSIQANVPALAMEEIAPVAVSDAAMLAPEEVFAGKGDIKEEAELTKAERKRRRASKKRKFKAGASKRMSKKAQEHGKEETD